MEIEVGMGCSVWLQVCGGPWQICIDHLLFSGLIWSIISMVTRICCEIEGKKSNYLKNRHGSSISHWAWECGSVAQRRKDCAIRSLGWPSQGLQSIFNSSVTINNWHWQEKEQTFLKSESGCQNLKVLNWTQLLTCFWFLSLIIFCYESLTHPINNHWVLIWGKA